MAEENVGYIDLPYMSSPLFSKPHWICNFRKFTTLGQALAYRKEMLEKAGLWSDEEQARQDVLAKEYGYTADDADTPLKNDSAGGSSDGGVASMPFDGSDVQPGIAGFLIFVGALQAFGGMIVTFSAFSESAESKIILLSIGLSSILTSAFWFGLARIVSELVRIRRALKG